jgi:hypothetical protein
VADVGGVRVANNVVGPFVARGVGVAGADVFLLEVLKLLEGAQLVGHDGDGDDGLSDVGGGIEQVVVSGQIMRGPPRVGMPRVQKSAASSVLSGLRVRPP